MGCGASQPTHPQPLTISPAPLANGISSSPADSFTQPNHHDDPAVTQQLSAITASKLQVERARHERERSSLSAGGHQQQQGPPQRTATIHPSNVTLLPPSTSPSPTLSPTRPAANSLSASSSPLSPPSATATPATPTLHPSQRYVLTGQVLGKGHFARVCLALDTLSSNRRVAVKQIDKKDMNKNRGIVEAEMSILHKMGTHRFIVGMLDWWEDERKFHIVMELCEGGDLFSKIVEQGKYSEREAVRCCRQIAEALVYMHSRGVIHRDLKPENILLLDSSIDSDLKIADFGLSKIVSSIDDVMRTVCGTWAYCAPEVISHRTYTSKVDNWTLGVLMFILLCGYHPFDCYGDLPEPELLDKIMKVEYEFEDPVWDTVSEQAKSLIRRLLRYKPDERLSLSEYLQSEWITATPTTASSATPSTVIAVRLSKMNQRAFRAVVTAKVAAKKFRASISKSPRTPTATSRTGVLVPTLGADAAANEPGGEAGHGLGGVGRGGSLSGSGGLSFLQRLDATGDARRSVATTNGSELSMGKHSPSSHSSRTRKEHHAHTASMGVVGVVGGGGGGGEREKGGLGRGMRISEEDIDEMCDSGREEKEMDEEEL